MKNRVELLSPVGSMEALKKAVNNGCDAVYLAGKSFGARAFANNFENDELVEAINYAHSLDVKVYVTVNTIIFEDEIEKALDFIDFLYLNNVDAVIVQDIGLASIIKKRYPGLGLHASTQMNCQTLEEVVTLKKLGFDRVVLGREVSLAEIKRIKENCDIEIEVFIHGALCVSYSGNCLMSSLIGSRSGNRGKCAQPCRMEYTFNGETKYYLSTKDLCTTSQIKDIIPYVDSLKIEGRMKNPIYVGVVTNNYKRIISDFYDNKKSIDLKDINYELKTVFNRDFTKGFLNNEKNKDITNINTQNHLGSYIGDIIDGSRKGYATIKIKRDIQREDCIRITSSTDESIIKDVVVINEIYLNKNNVKEAKAGSVITIKVHNRLDKGNKVFITKSVLLDNKYQNIKTVDITGSCNLEGNYFVLKVSDGVNTVEDRILVSPSSNNHTERIKEQLLKTKDTIFRFSKIDIEGMYCFIQIKDLNEFRRNILNKLYKMRIADKNRAINLKYDVKKKSNIYNIERKLKIVISNTEQLEAIKEFNNLDYNLFIRDYNLYKKLKEDCENVYYYLPRITKRNEENALTSNYKNLKNSFVSPYLNVVNSYAINVLESLGAKDIALSLEISKDRIKKTIDYYNNRNGSLPNVSIMIYGYYQAMIMKHCFINKANNQDKLNCNLCKNAYVTDRMNVSYPVMRDENCNLSILYSKPVCLFTKLDELEKMGVKSFMIDFTIESKEEVNNIINCYLNKKGDGINYFGHYLNNDL